MYSWLLKFVAAFLLGVAVNLYYPQYMTWMCLAGALFLTAEGLRQILKIEWARKVLSEIKSEIGMAALASAGTLLAAAIVALYVWIIWSALLPLRIEPPLEQWAFKESHLFTQERKVYIATEITKFRQYLGTVGFDTGNEMPPIEVISAENPTGSYAATFGGPVYYDSLKLKANQLDNAVAITSAYSSYYFIKILMEPVFRLPDQGVCTWGGGSKHNQFSAFTFELYFNWSFWGKRTEDANLPSVLAFWEMRGRFGKESTDRLVAFTAKAFIDNTCGDKSADWEQYFYERVRIADQIVDSESSKLPAIKEILGRFGIQPK